MIGHVTWTLIYVLNRDREKIRRWPNDKTNDSCENDLYTIKQKEF